MNEEQNKKVDELRDVLVEAVDACELALEERTRDNIQAAYAKVDRAAALYRSLEVELGQTPDGAELRKRFERRLQDLKLQAGRLPRGSGGGTHVATASDAGSVPFILQRAPGKSIQNIDAPVQRGERPRYTTGGEVDAWCGPCDGMKTHNIYALVDGEPTIVICQACGGRHKFRTTPARKKGSGLPDAAGRPAAQLKGPRIDAEAEKRAREQAQLRAELAAATNVRAFSPQERYKAGELIDHPVHGRGKVESVTRRSLLVRFSVGLRPLDLR